MRIWIVLIPLGALQFASGIFLLWDIAGSVLGITSSPIAWVYYELAQIGAVIGLILGVVVSGVMMLRSVRRQRVAEESLRLASGAFMDVLSERFADWELTPAERDVALFLIKGLSTSDIAALRQTSEGTVKAQTNAIYRKADVSGRPQLLSLFIEDLMGNALPGVAASQPEQVGKAS